MTSPHNTQDQAAKTAQQSQFTPGPWMVSDDKFDGIRGVVAGKGDDMHSIVHMASANNEAEWQEKQANARGRAS